MCLLTLTAPVPSTCRIYKNLLNEYTRNMIVKIKNNLHTVPSMGWYRVGTRKIIAVNVPKNNTKKFYS